MVEYGQGLADAGIEPQDNCGGEGEQIDMLSGNLNYSVRSGD
jgi:hypothetical protein